MSVVDIVIANDAKKMETEHLMDWKVCYLYVDQTLYYLADIPYPYIHTSPVRVRSYASIYCPIIFIFTVPDIEYKSKRMLMLCRTHGVLKGDV